jgi:hypothetical protein
VDRWRFPEFQEREERPGQVEDGASADIIKEEGASTRLFRPPEVDKEKEMLAE